MALGVYTVASVTTTAGLIDQITDCQYTPGLQEMLLSGDGAVDALFSAGLAASPVISFTTSAINSAMGFVGLNGYAETDDATVFWQRISNQGIRGGSSSHLKMTIGNALIVPRTLQASQDDTSGATITYDMIAISTNGTASPIAIAENQSLTGSPTVDEAYTLGEVKLNNVDLTYAQSVTVDFGISETVIRNNGLPFPIFAAIMTRRPSIRITTNDMDWVHAIGASDIARVAGTVKSNDTRVQFRQVTQGGVPSASFMTLTMNEGRMSIQNAGGSSEAPGTVEIMVTPTYNGSNAVLVLS